MIRHILTAALVSQYPAWVQELIRKGVAKPVAVKWYLMHPKGKPTEIFRGRLWNNAGGVERWNVIGPRIPRAGRVMTLDQMKEQFETVRTQDGKPVFDPDSDRIDRDVDFEVNR